MSDHWFLDWSARPSSLHTPASSNREGGGGIPRDSGRKTRDNPPVSHLSASYLPLAGHRSPPRLNLYRRRFEWREDPLLPDLLLSTISPINYSFPYSFYSVFFERSEPLPANIEISSQKGSGTISREGRSVTETFHLANQLQYEPRDLVSPRQSERIELYSIFAPSSRP